MTTSVRDESTPPEALRVIAHIAPSDAPMRFVEFPMVYDIENRVHIILLPNFPESIFGQEITTQVFAVSILAEDDSGNSADPLVTSVVVSDTPPPWNPDGADLNADGSIDADDLLILRQFWHQHTEGDVNADGFWGPLDLLLYQLSWSTQHE
jgi:hypothetical protein